ncbi:MAG TPA: PTS sugar transporter subunit IIC, partial [Enterococcus sp.]|nr:PTS sugar transporter subunit IIC [Enterococcus sp.]
MYIMNHQQTAIAASNTGNVVYEDDEEIEIDD